MSDHAQDSTYYSDDILGGIVELLRVCKEIRSRFGSDAKFTSSNFRFTEWKMNDDTVESVNAALSEKYRDPQFIATVWAAIFYEKPVILTLHDTSPESTAYATIHTRPLAQQRLSIYIYVVLYCMGEGIFDSGADSNAAMHTLPSLEMLQHFKVDKDNKIMCMFIGALAGLDRPIKLDELASIVPGGSIVFAPARPLGEVMLPLNHEDKLEMMRTDGAVPAWYLADHTALLFKIHAHFRAAGCAEYFMVENGPPMVANSFDAAMHVLPFKHAFRSPILGDCGGENFHFFWRMGF